MKKNKAFTLIELIAVITLLALILLVSVPVVINTITKTEEKEYNEFKKAIENAAELYIEHNRDLYPELNTIGESIDLSTEILINEGYLKNDLTDPIDNNPISKYRVFVFKDKEQIINYETVEIQTLYELATTTKDVKSIHTCALEGNCEPGTMFAIRVNDNEIYNFYVIADYGDEVALIMDRNVGPKVAWISVEDYNKVNINNYLCGEYDACSYYGPITAVNSLKLNTEMWSNIIRREYTYEDFTLIK